MEDNNWKSVTKFLPALSIPRHEYGVAWTESALVLIRYDTKTDEGCSYGIARYTTDGWVGIGYDGLVDLSKYEVLYWKPLETIY